MELVGRSNWSNRGNGSCQGERGGGCDWDGGGGEGDGGCSKRSRREDRLRSRGRSWDKGELFRSKHLVHRNKVVEGRSKRSSHRSWGNGGRDGVNNMVEDGGRDIVDKGNWKTKDRSCRNLIISFNGFSFSLLHTGSSSSGLSMSCKVFSSSSSNFRGLLRGNRGAAAGATGATGRAAGAASGATGMLVPATLNPLTSSAMWCTVWRTPLASTY